MLNSFQMLSLLAALCAFPVGRFHAFEISLYAHRVLAVAVSIIAWVHTRGGDTTSQTLFLGSVIMLSAFVSIHWIRQAYLNLTWEKGRLRTLHSATTEIVSNALVVRIVTSSRWSFRPGQYVYLSLITLQFGSFLQRHPFVLTWWDWSTAAGGNDPSEVTLHLVIVPKRGLTRRLCAAQARGDWGSGSKGLPTVWLDGPFGNGYDPASFDLIFLFAEDDGIFAVLPLVKALTEHSRESMKKCQTRLIWKTKNIYEPARVWLESVLHETVDDESALQFLHVSFFMPEDIYRALKDDEKGGGRRVTISPGKVIVSTHLNADEIGRKTKVGVYGTYVNRGLLAPAYNGSFCVTWFASRSAHGGCASRPSGCKSRGTGVPAFWLIEVYWMISVRSINANRNCARSIV